MGKAKKSKVYSQALLNLNKDITNIEKDFVATKS